MLRLGSLSGPRNAQTRFLTAAKSFASHSQTTKHSHPIAARRAACSASRSVFRVSFGSQYSCWVFGTVAKRRPGCECQKHPFKQIAFRRRPKTISGVPGKPRPWIRKRYPIACSIERKSNSGLVFLPLFPAIDLRMEGDTPGHTEGRVPFVDKVIASGLLLIGALTCPKSTEYEIARQNFPTFGEYLVSFIFRVPPYDP